MSIISQLGIGDIEIARQWFGCHAALYYYDNDNDGTLLEFEPNTSGYDHYIPKMIMRNGKIAADLCEPHPEMPYRLEPRFHLKFDDYDALPFPIEPMYPEITDIIIRPERVVDGICSAQAPHTIDLTNMPSTADKVIIDLTGAADFKKIICDKPIGVYHNISIRGLQNIKEYDFSIKFYRASTWGAPKIEYDGDISRLHIEDNDFALSIPPISGDEERCFDDAANIIASGSIDTLVTDNRLLDLIKRIQKTMPGVKIIDAGGVKAIIRRKKAWYYTISNAMS